ncbi:MAG TPA: hypothetical protein VKE94_03585 [Gemmataceae bacterium]|nr:hypothetical protein [Gemmataceae bacterium]
MNALANDEVGKYVSEHFVSSFQKVATFRIVGGQKQGGNVASYFCTPDSRVLHVVAGPVNAATMLRESRWVVEAYKLAELNGAGDPADLAEFVRRGHADRLRREHALDVAAPDVGLGRRALSNQGRVHLLLAAAPLVKVEQVYDLVFEKILGEQVSTSPVVEARQ